MSCSDVQSRLAEEVFRGILAPRTAAHLRGCAACATEHASLVDVFASLGAAAPAAAVPSAALRERLLLSTRQGRPLPSFARGVARLFDVDEAAARALLEAAAAGEGWRDGPSPGHQLRLVRPGPGAGEAALACLMRFAPGEALARHRHVGRERVLVLQGGFTDDSGREWWAGEIAEQPPGSVHRIVALPPVDCIAAALVVGGLVPV